MNIIEHRSIVMEIPLFSMRVVIYLKTVIKNMNNLSRVLCVGWQSINKEQ